MAELAQAQSVLKETLAKVATLEAQFDEANTKKVSFGFWFRVGARICSEIKKNMPDEAMGNADAEEGR